MNDPASRLAEDAGTVRSAAQRLHDHALDAACAAAVPVTLASIEDAVTALSRTAYAAAHALIPPGNSDDSIGTRYSRAATMWPSPRGGVGPSHEQQARVLSSLHEAGAALRAAAAHCGRAAQNVAATTEPAECLPGHYARRSEAA